MVIPSKEHAPIVHRAIAAYEGLISLYKLENVSDTYFFHCLAEAETKRDGLQERLSDPVYLADVFKDNYFLSIDHFLESHRGEYGPDMPGADPYKARLAGKYLAELSAVIDDIIRVKNAQKENTQSSS